MNIRVVLFPDGEDPDSFSRKNSQEFVKNYLDAEAKDFIDFKAEVLLKEADTDPIKKAEAIRDIVKSVAFVQNALKQEVYLKEVATKFGISEQTLFNELGIQKQIKQKDEPAVHVNAPVKLQVVTENLVLINPLLELEDRLIQLILKNGDVVLTRKDDDNNPFEITVLEEIIMHIYEDDYEVQNPLNQKIFSEIKEGLEKDELRAGQFFLSLMDEGISTKIANALIDSHENSDWGRHNIYFPSLDEKIGEAVAETLLKHKREYIQSIILKLKNELQQENLSEERRSEIYITIMKITQLRNQIAQEVYRVL
jgi:DNA primase